MPLGKRKRSFVKSRSRKRLKSLVGSIVRKNIETSSIVHSLDAVSIVDSGRVSSTQDIHLTAIAQGVQESQRIKNEVRITGVYGDLFVTGADSTNSIRLIMYIPKDPTVSLSNSPTLAFNEAPDLDKFTILKDMLVTTSSGGPNLRRLKLKYKFKGRGLRVGYSGTGAGDVQTHPVYFYFVSDSLASTDPSLNGYIRMYYKDA